MNIKAYAKINLFLEILNKRDDGFHEISTVMQEVDLADELSIDEAAEGISLTCDKPDIPTGPDNLICKAVEIFKKRLKIDKGVKINLVKKIPVGAGLGGGSSDAAAALKALNVLWGSGQSDGELMDMAAEIGSDVPFFINGKTAFCSGRGEIVSPISVKKKYNYVLIYPNLKIGTANIYKNLSLRLTKDKKDVNFFLNLLKDEDALYIGKSLFNRLTDTIYNLYPELVKVRTILDEVGFSGFQISGSGSSLFGLCERRCDAEDIKKKLDRLCIAEVFVVSNCIEQN